MALKKINIKKSEYENLYDCIRTDQVPPDQVAYLFTNKQFYNWYVKQRDKKASWE
jgi:hypothetical protein